MRIHPGWDTSLPQTIHTQPKIKHRKLPANPFWTQEPLREPVLLQHQQYFLQALMPLDPETVLFPAQSLPLQTEQKSTSCCYMLLYGVLHIFSAMR